MEKLVLNETPLRTSNNFNINNIVLDDAYLPSEISEFKNVNVLNNSSKIKIEDSIDNNTVKYGISEELLKLHQYKFNKQYKINIDTKISKDTIFEFSFDKDNINLVDNIEIIANENTKSTIILKYMSKEDIKCFHSLKLNLFAKNSSYVNVIILNLLNMKSHNYLTIQNELQENSNVKYTIVDFGGRYSISNYYSNLIGSSANNTINTMYLGANNQLFDINYITELRSKNSNVDIKVQGALNDESKKHFKGTIDFKRGAKKSTGNENDSCMILSDKAKSISLPMLLCSEEDVEGNHASSAGKVGEKELFYLMSRGFNKKEAMKLMVKAKFNDIIEDIKNEDIKQLVLQKIDEKLD